VKFLLYNVACTLKVNNTLCKKMSVAAGTCATH